MEKIERIRAQLVSVRAAIEAIEGGAQEYTIGTRHLKRADLQTLYDREKMLETQLVRMEGRDIYFAELGRL